MGESIDRGALYGKIQAATGFDISPSNTTLGVAGGTPPDPKWYIRINETGTKGAEATRALLKKSYPGAVVSSEIVADVYDKNGKFVAETRFDFVVHDGEGKVIGVVESKASTKGKYNINSRGQRGVYIDGDDFVLRGPKAIDINLGGYSSKGKNFTRQVSETAVENGKAIKTQLKNILKKVN